MGQIDSNHEDDLDDLVSRVKSRRTEAGRPSAPVTQADGLKPSEILFMPGEQKKLINYLSRQQHARIDEITQALAMDRLQALKILSTLKNDGYIHEMLVDGKVSYRVKFVDTSSRNRKLPKELWNALSLDRVAFLRQLSLFTNLTETDLDWISQQFKQDHYARNDIIVQQGDTSKSFFIIQSGVVAVSNLSSSGDYNLIRYLEQGDFFGESGLLTGQAVSATVTAFTPVDILVINKDDFYTMLTKYVGITLELARTLAYRLSDMNTRLANKFIDSSLFIVISAGKGSGATTVATAIALMIAASPKVSPTAYIEFPQQEFASILGFPANSEIYNHPGGFRVLNPKSGANIPELAQLTLVVDQASAQFKNIVICIPWELGQQLEALVGSSSQIIVVTSPRREDWEHTQKVLASLKPVIRASKTRILTVVNHTQPDVSGEKPEATPDFEIPFLGNLPLVGERRVENLPTPLTAIISEIFKWMEYTNQIGIYIPFTMGVDKQANTAFYVEKTLSFMGTLLGDATYEQVQGVWNSQEAGRVEEGLHLVRSSCSQFVLDKHMGEVVDYAETLKLELQQEAIAIEVNQKLMLI